MTKLRYLLESASSDLWLNVEHHKKAGRYARNESWAEGYFKGLGQEWFGASTIDVPDDLILEHPVGTTTSEELRDFVNVKTLYEGLKHLSPTEATEGRLWDYLSHVTYWSYMRKRWGKDNKTAGAIKSRYVMGPRTGKGARTLLRHGIARLWWFGYASYDDERSDPYALTAFALSKQDIQQSILERNFSHNRTVTKTLLSVFVEELPADRLFGRLSSKKQRNCVRLVSKELNRLGGVSLLDVLDAAELETYIRRVLVQVSSELQP
jgi:hypothetical protein